MNPWTVASSMWRSSTGKKVVMAASGLILVGYILTHVLANLLIYLGPEWINGYGALLHATGPLLWIVRGVLLVAFVLHVVAAAQLSWQKRLARPTQYEVREPQTSTIASRSMGWGGVALLLFVLYHVPQMTAGWWHPRFVSGDDYGNVITLFDVPWTVPVYAAALLALGLHLYHGTWSMVRTLGVASEPARRTRPVATTFTFLVTVGFLSIIVAVVSGMLDRQGRPRPSLPRTPTPAATRH